MTTQDSITIRYALISYSFLLPRNFKRTAAEFANVIAGYSSHMRAHYCASVIRKYPDIMYQRNHIPQALA